MFHPPEATKQIHQTAKSLKSLSNLFRPLQPIVSGSDGGWLEEQRGSTQKRGNVKEAQLNLTCLGGRDSEEKGRDYLLEEMLT